MKSMLKWLSALAVLFLIALNVRMSRNEQQAILLSLSDLEKEVQAEGIDYSVPQMNNNPQECKLYINAEGDVSTDEGLHLEFGWRKVDGMKNFCKEPDEGKEPTGCDPYNCHQRL